MDRRKVLQSEVPYIELFGVDGMGKGRPGNDTLAAGLIPKLDLPVMGDAGVAMQIRSQARTRALTVIKTVFAKEFLAVYEKEVRHLVGVHYARLKVGSESMVGSTTTMEAGDQHGG